MIFIDDKAKLGEEETNNIMLEEMEYWQGKGKELHRLTITEEDGEIVVMSVPHQKIKRIRRITGYLSEVNNFNEAKQAELKDRVKHGGE